MSLSPPNDEQLFADVRGLIEAARQRVALSVNAELTLLYWQVGRQVRRTVLAGERADYGKEVVARLAERLGRVYGRGWSEQQLWHCLRLAETFPDEAILYAVRRELSWTHIRTLMYLDDPLKRDFYTELSRLEGWSSRQLRERINSMLYERSALSKQPEPLIKQELAQLRGGGKVSAQMLLKDPYLLDFLGLQDRYLEKRLGGRHLARAGEFYARVGCEL